MSNDELRPDELLYSEICRNHQDLLKDLKTEMDGFASGKNEFTNLEAKDSIFDTWARFDEWKQICGKWRSHVFGQVLFDHFKEKGWSIRKEDRDNREVKVYRKR